MSNISNFTASSRAILVAVFIATSLFTSPVFAGFDKIEEELRGALSAGHAAELSENGITAEDLSGLYIIDKPLKLYGLSSESSSQSLEMSNFGSYFTRIDFNQPYQFELTKNISNFVAVIKGMPFILCDIFVENDSYKLLGFRRVTEGLDLSQLISTSDNEIFLTPQTTFTRSKNGYLLNRKKAQDTTRSKKDNSLVTTQEIGKDELIGILNEEYEFIRSGISIASEDEQQYSKRSKRGSVDCPISADYCRINGISGKFQALNKWCWTAATQTIASYYGWNITPCDIAYYGLLSKKYKYNDCYDAGAWISGCTGTNKILFDIESYTINCNQYGGLILSINALTDYYGSIQAYSCESSDCLKNPIKMREYLSKGLPLYIGRAWTSGGGHAYTVGGYYKSSNSYYLIAWDPWVNTQNYLLSSNTEWTDLKVDSSLDVIQWGTFWQYGSGFSDGVSKSGSLSQGERRYYKLTVNSNYNKFKVDLTNLSNDLDLYIYKSISDNTLVGQSDNGGTTSESVSANNSGTNDYYIRVDGYRAGNFTVKVTLQTTNFHMSVSKQGSGSGTVSSNPSGISCGSACLQSYNQGASVTLTASPSTGSAFGGWSGACSGTTCTVSMNAIKLVTATFNTVSAGISLSEAADNTSLNFTTGGNVNWFGQSNYSYNGSDAAQSGKISHNQKSYMQTTVSGPRSLSFYWKVSSENNWDFLKFYIDGVEQAKISGEVSWGKKTYSISSGTHTLKWEYSKDGSGSYGSDAGWVDKVLLQ